MKQTNFAILGIIAGIALMSTVGIQDASAHQLATLKGDGVRTNDIFFVLGHTNEPAFGADPGIHDGKGPSQANPIGRRSTSNPDSWRNIHVSIR